MKKIFLLIILLSFFFSGKRCLAQEMTVEGQYQLFLKNYRLYQAASDSYKNAKSKYLSYQSVSSRADYLESAKKYLILEIEAGESYAIFIRRRLTEATKILNYQENVYFIRLDDEITFLSLLKNKVNGADSITGLLGYWVDFETHFENISAYGYAIKAYIEIASLEKINDNLKIFRDNVDRYLAENPSGNPYVKAARDSFTVLEKDYVKIGVLVNNLKIRKNSLASGKASSETANSIRAEVDQTLTQIRLLTVNYRKLLQTVVSK